MEQLAYELGTTPDQLWSVLLKQAFMAGVTDLIMYALLIVAMVAIFRWYKYFATNFAEIQNQIFMLFINGVGLIVSTLFVLASLIAAAYNVQNTMAAFFNPEYWALQKIFSSLGR